MRRLLRKVIFGLLLSATMAQAGIRLSPQHIGNSSFAIFVDEKTFGFAEKEILAYREQVESQDLSCYIFTDKYHKPEMLRRQICDLYEKDGKLEGVVLIGDIPIPMLRDAQHLTSAFKIDQSNRYPLWKTSVPSDRFYEDFDLKFEFVKQDTANPLLFYYSLMPDSPQRVEKEIYSGRIFAPVSDKTKYEAIKHYLTKLVAVKKKRQQLSQALFFTGHGYHSESLSAWEGEALALREQFPQLYLPGNRLFNYNHSMSPDLKETILRLIDREHLNLTVFHAHGASDKQYLLGNPPTGTINAQIEAVKFFLRSKLRTAKARKKSVAQTKLNYMERLGIPLDWFTGAFDDSVMRADSLAAAKMDIYSQDVKNISPLSNMIIFDECFNGAFFRQGYQAGEYLFNEGETVVAIVNSVNVLQDIWADEFLGLIGLGARVGLVHRLNPYLESHILGDPTFQFVNEKSEETNSLLLKNDNSIDWSGLETLLSAPLRSLAIFELSQSEDKKTIDKFRTIYQTDESFIVRAEVLRALARTRSSKFEELLLRSINDPFEFIRRKSAVLMGDVGREKFVTPLMIAALSDPSERVVFSAKTALSKIAVGENEVGKYIGELANRFSADAIIKLLKTTSIARAKDVREEYLPKIGDEKLPLRKRISAIRFFRNYRFHAAVPELITLAKSKSIDDNLRKTIIEALGWFVYSYQNKRIIKFCDSVLADKNADGIMQREALKTKNRLLAGANHPLTP